MPCGQHAPRDPLPAVLRCEELPGLQAEVATLRADLASANAELAVLRDRERTQDERLREVQGYLAAALELKRSRPSS